MIYKQDYEILLKDYFDKMYPTKDAFDGTFEPCFDTCFYNWLGTDDWMKVISEIQIVTFCEDGPHDTLYFNDPIPMFRGDPRKPWIDIRSEKLIQRHLAMVILQEYNGICL